MQHIAKFETHERAWVVDCPHARSVMDEDSIVVFTGTPAPLSNPTALFMLCAYHEQKGGCGCAVRANAMVLAQRN